MNQLSDQELLRRYVQDHSEAAFTALVERHVDLVYSVALRLVIERQLAEDVTQSVFLAVIREAVKLQNCAVLSAWLHRTTRNQAAVLVRGEVRRRAREKEAATMNLDSENDERLWEQLAPQLDAALTRLSADDRDALLLRFFERKTAREIGERLGLSEEAAQKRVLRALEKLRGIFSQQGVTLTAASLACVLSAQVIQAAPAALTAAITTAAFTTVATATTVSTFNLFTFMASTQLKTGAVALVTAGLLTTVVMQHQANQKLHAELVERESRITRPTPVKAISSNEVDQAELERLRGQTPELMRLRSEVGLLRQQIRQSTETKPAVEKANKPVHLPSDFIASDHWQNVGTATPQHAFQSFLARLKAGDLVQIADTVSWEFRWLDKMTSEDIALMEKSKQDYLEMLQRAPQRIAAYNLAPVAEDATERTRVFFQLQTATGEKVDSSFEMRQENGQWKPVLSMGWRNPGDRESFSTSPVFGPKVDLD